MGESTPTASRSASRSCRATATWSSTAPAVRWCGRATPTATPAPGSWCRTTATWSSTAPTVPRPGTPARGSRRGPVATGDDMQPGEVLNPGQSISSANGRYVFVYQGDGNLVLYGPAGALWASNTNGQPVGVDHHARRRQPRRLRPRRHGRVGQQHRRQPGCAGSSSRTTATSSSTALTAAPSGRPTRGCRPALGRAGTTWPPARCSTPGSRSAPRTAATPSRTRRTATWCSTDPRAHSGPATPTASRSGVTIMQGRREPGHLRPRRDRGLGQQHRRQPRRPTRRPERRQRRHLPHRRLRPLGHQHRPALTRPSQHRGEQLTIARGPFGRAPPRSERRRCAVVHGSRAPAEDSR